MELLTAAQFAAVLNALENGHRQLVAHAGGLLPEGPSNATYCTAWTVAQVYSHLGSGAEINAAAIRAARAGGPPVDPRPIWAVWDDRSPQAMIDGFVDADRDLIDLLGGLGADDRAQIAVPMLGAMTVPLDLAVLLRLSEHALHSWDIRVGADPAAEVADDAAVLLAALFPLDVLSLLLTRQLVGRCGPGVVDIEVAVAPGQRRAVRLTLGRAAALSLRSETGPTGDPGPATGRIELPSAATWARLLTGRLDADHRPDGVRAEGTPTPDELWQALQEEPDEDLGAQSPA